MTYVVDGKEYEVIIEKKNNKNTYIRIKDDLKIYVTTNYLVTNVNIKKLLDNNYNFLSKSLKRKEEKQIKETEFYLLGKKYDIIIMDTKNIEIIDNRIYAKSKAYLDAWLKKEIKKVFEERLDINYSKFKEDIPYPHLRIRKMKTRWGVCNGKSKVVTLNSELIRYSIDKLDYVIVHELSHFIHPNHSKNFWTLVSKYCPSYKQIRKEMR